VTQLPLQSLRRLQRWRYLAARTLLFPLSRLPHGEALARVEALQQGLRRLSERRGIELLEPAAHWYGADPIHIRRRFRSEAWRRFLAVETTGVAVAPARDLCRGGLAPLSSKVFGRERRCEQPCVRLGDGSTVSLF
jgi:hypothetical protein